MTDPPRIPPWIAAPIATTSSGFTPLCGSLPNRALTVSWTLGTLVDPPTRMTSSISAAVSPASLRAFWQGIFVLSMRSSISCSKAALVRVICRCFGPVASAEMNGRLISVDVELESSILAFSAASFSLWRAILSVERSIPVSFLKELTIHSMILWSKLSPPRCVSPFVDLTSKTPSPSSRMEISNVPPPRS